MNLKKWNFRIAVVAVLATRAAAPGAGAELGHGRLHRHQHDQLLVLLQRRLPHRRYQPWRAALAPRWRRRASRLHRIQTLPKPGPGSTVGGYGEALVGGYAGVAGNVNSLPDPTGKGALRFTNGAPNGNNESGAIVSAAPFPTGQGVAVTFKTVTYRGDSGSPLHDGADGISFFLMDATVSPNIGAYGGSLGYSCAQGKGDGMVGAYIGLGIDEYGNFLNGQTLMPGYIGTNVATGDNSALGYGYRPNRIGIRGAGNVAWSWLNANYYTAAFPATTFTAAQQLAAVKATCATGIVADPTNPATNLMVSGAASRWPTTRPFPMRMWNSPTPP